MLFTFHYDYVERAVFIDAGSTAVCEGYAHNAVAVAIPFGEAGHCGLRVVEGGFLVGVSLVVALDLMLHLSEADIMLVVPLI